MKKFLSVVSLLLVAMMVLATPAVSAAENEWTAPEGANVYTAKYMSVLSPTLDGYIEEGEYGDCLAKITDPVKSGCGASVSLAGLALVATLGTCTVFVAKKKEN